QDATRVVHYDLPWSPARLAQRVGRVDRLGSPHTRVETVTFLPPPALEGALAVEQRLATKLVTQAAAGAAQLESVAGPEAARGRRLMPWGLGAARRAAQRGDARQLSRLDALVSRLALGMTAGEELLLEQLLARRTPLSVRDVLAWHAGLPPLPEGGVAPRAELVVAVAIQPQRPA